MGIFDIFKRKSKNPPECKEFNILKLEEGELSSFNSKLKQKPFIALIVGKRGGGKTALGFRIMENAYVASKRKCFALNFPNHSLPGWIKHASAFDEIPNNSIVIIDEAGIQFSSRRSMTKNALDLNNILVIARHKKLSMIIITQNSAIVDVNILRQIDTLFMKKPSLLQKEMERNFLRELYGKKEDYFKKFKDYPPESLFYILDDDLKAFASFDLPSFWQDNISTSWQKA